MAVVDIVTGEVIDPKEYRGVWYSASLLEDMAQCPAKAYGRITKQKQMNPGLALINGIAVHYGMERWLKDRKDPIKTYNDTYKLEAEKQGVNWKSDEAEEKRREGEKMLAATWAQYKDPRFLERVDPKLVEPKFRVMRDGRMFVGKLDLLFFKEPGRYNYVDFKSSKNPPSQWELDNDIQFNLYPWASFYSDELPTNGIWPEYGVWFHMRGKNITKGDDGKTKRLKNGEKWGDDPSRVWQFDFRTTPTKQSVDQIFKDTIDPLCADIEDGRWRRNRTADCNYCPFFNKMKNQCGAELPMDGLAERSNQISLLDVDPKAA